MFGITFSKRAINAAALAPVLCPQEVQLVLEIHKAANSATSARDAEKNKNNADRRTKLVIQSIDDLGKRLGYEPRSKYQGPAWLFDEVWLSKRQPGWINPQHFISETKWSGFQGIKLACECEWNGHIDKVLEDFAKLVIARADFRLFVHCNPGYPEQPNGPPAPGLLATACRSIVPHSCGHRYLFVGFDDDVSKPDFRVDLFIA